MLHVPEMDAEECSQDVLLKMYSKVANFRNDGRSKLTTWIFEIAKNCAIDFHRVAQDEPQKLTENSEPVHIRYAFFPPAKPASLTQRENELWLGFLADGRSDHRVIGFHPDDAPEGALQRRGATVFESGARRTARFIALARSASSNIDCRSDVVSIKLDHNAFQRA